MTAPDHATTDSLTAVDEQADPRLARSRNRLLDAATHLLSTGGVEAVTVEAVTRMSRVARATLYRHFGSTNHLLAATFERLLPHVDTPSGTGPVRERLIALLTTESDLIEQAPVQMTTLAWLAMGSLGDAHTDPARRPDPAAITSLRARIIEQYRQPFDYILTSPRRPCHARRTRHHLRPHRTPRPDRLRTPHRTAHHRPRRLHPTRRQLPHHPPNRRGINHSGRAQNAVTEDLGQSVRTKSVADPQSPVS